MVILCGRFIEIFNSSVEEYIPTASHILQHLIQLQSKLIQMYESNTQLSELIASVFGTFNLFINWIILFRKSLNQGNVDQLETISSIINYLANLCIICSSKQVILFYLYIRINKSQALQVHY